MVSLRSFKLISEDQDATKLSEIKRNKLSLHSNKLIGQEQQQQQQLIFQQESTLGRQYNQTVVVNDTQCEISNSNLKGDTTEASQNNRSHSIAENNNNSSKFETTDSKLNNQKMSHPMGTDVQQIVGDNSDQQRQDKCLTMTPEPKRSAKKSHTAVVSITLPPQHKDNDIAQTVDNESIISPAPSSSSISIVVVTHDGSNHHDALKSNDTPSTDEGYTNDASSDHSLEGKEEGQLNAILQLSNDQVDLKANKPFKHCNSDLFIEGDRFSSSQQVFRNNLMNYSVPFKSTQQLGGTPPDMASRLSVTTESEHFEIVWSELSYRIEPKWYKRFNYVDRFISYFTGQTVDNHSSATSTASSSAGMNDNQHQMHHDSPTNKDCPVNDSAKQKSLLEPIEIFANLNGTIKSGQMTAVLGPSGAGKTTLLNCLTGKLRSGVSGNIHLKGANGKNLKMCTIPQKDHLLELLTVEENLWFASKIKNPEYGFDHTKNIERVIDLLGLKRCRSAKIGKISGGQHKRVSIAQELLSNPDILVLDEPTSGLDSLTCFKTISMLRDLVELSANNDFMKPMAIIVTIHQPQPKVFNLFHHVYILANGGRVIFEGSPEQSLTTITSIAGLKPFESSKTANPVIDPASFLIEIASEEYGVDVINTLNDHQKSAFHERNNARNLHRQLHHAAKNLTADNQNAKENFAFTPDFVPESGKLKASTNVYVPDQAEEQQTNSTENNGKQTISEQQFNNGDSRRSSKSKRRKKSTSSLESGTLYNNSCGQNSNTSQDAVQEEDDPNLFMSEQLLYTRVPNHKGRFWSHTVTLTHRTLLTIRRDPLLMTSRILFHLMIPILMGHVYGKSTGAANACPHYEPEIDITQIPSLVEGKRIEYMLEELHMSIENVSMFFIIMYAFAAAVLALNALSFPLNMQVLLKETRNGWYSMSSYVVAKTVADLPLELTMPCLTMLLVYPMTGQPSSYLQWRMLTICLIMTLCSLIAQTQALILGALVMNSVQTAVFVSQASQLPWVILAGFTIRIKRLSEPLKLISLTSFYRLGCEAITLTRYGFGICPCDPQEITGEPVRLVGIPDQLRTVAQYWIDSMEANKANNDTLAESDDSRADLVGAMIATTTTTASPMTSISATKTDIFQHLANQLSYANSYGVNITSCDDVAPDRIRAINLGDNWLVARIWHLLFMLVIMKILLYYAVKFSIGIRL